MIKVAASKDGLSVLWAEQRDAVALAAVAPIGETPTQGVVTLGGILAQIDAGEWDWEEPDPVGDSFAKLMKLFDPDQPRDDHGRWTSEGGGDAFVSPNIDEGLSLDTAAARVRGERQRSLQREYQEIDRVLGVHSETHPAIGAWADGAENSAVSTYAAGTGFETIRASAAMKGLISDQKAVLAFANERGGPNVMFETSVQSTDIAALNKSLVGAGIEFHTLMPGRTHTKVIVFDESGDIAPRVVAWGKENGGRIKAHEGRGEFIGSWDSREDGARAYQRVIGEWLDSAGRDRVGVRDEWNRIRDRWSKTAE